MSSSASIRKETMSAHCQISPALDRLERFLTIMLFLLELGTMEGRWGTGGGTLLSPVGLTVAKLFEEPLA